MSLHPVLEEKLNAALASAALPAFTRRGAETGYVITGEGFEVDFLARNRAAGEELLQVCADPTAPETSARALRALAEAAKEHPRASRRLLVLDRDTVVRLKAPGVQVQPVYEWLLSERGATP